MKFENVEVLVALAAINHQDYSATGRDRLKGDEAANRGYPFE
ncbi:hypothetical protein [Paenibacillus antibioticophila]|nr:hypothetical protein [Paenibacillus antibioticophila]